MRLKPQSLLSRVTKVTKNTFFFQHSATADGLNSARLIGTQRCIPITVTAIKINLTLYVLSAAYGHSLAYFLKHFAVSLLRSKSQHFSFFVR